MINIERKGAQMSVEKARHGTNEKEGKKERKE